MRKIIFFLMLFVFLGFPIKISAFSVSAKAAIVIDSATGRVIFSKNADEKLPMASTTKITTAITAIENGNLSDVVTVSANAAGTEGSSVWLQAGEKLTLEDLLYALMLESGNDAAVAIAEHVGGDVPAFLSMMNETAVSAGAKSTNCVTPNGLDDEFHYTTAYDLAMISAYAMKSAYFREIVSCYKATIPWEGKEWDRQLVNHNKLLTMYDGATGIKTGFTKKSGRCLVSSAEKDGWEIIAVTLNAPDDWNDHINMLNYAFEAFPEDAVILEKETSLGDIKVLGSKSKVSYGVCRNIKYRKLSDTDSFEIKYSLPKKLIAPINNKDTIGEVQIYCNGNLCEKVPLVALNPAKQDKKTYILMESFKKSLMVLLNLVR